MCTWVAVEKLDGSGGVATNAGELARLLGCEVRDLVPEPCLDGWFRDGFECLCRLDERNTAHRFGYYVSFDPDDCSDVRMIQRGARQ